MEMCACVKRYAWSWSIRKSIKTITQLLHNSNFKFWALKIRNLLWLFLHTCYLPWWNYMIWYDLSKVILSLDYRVFSHHIFERNCAVSNQSISWQGRQENQKNNSWQKSRAWDAKSACPHRTSLLDGWMLKLINSD